MAFNPKPDEKKKKKKKKKKKDPSGKSLAEMQEDVNKSSEAIEKLKKEQQARARDGAIVRILGEPGGGR